MKKRFRKLLSILLMLGFSIGFAGVIGELFFRWALFSAGDSFKGLRQPEDFAHVLSPEYWQLRHYFGTDEMFPPPKEPLPELGWGHVFFRGCYMHKDMYKKPYDKRPVLLYGDSFAMTVPAAESFQDILNADTAFTRDHHFINYGVGGYGVGQINMLMQRSVSKFHKPFVVFSFLTSDLDRTILPWRTGQKPQFDVEGDSLVVRNLPIDPDSDHWLEENGVGITSYLWRRFLYSKVNFLPDFINGRSKDNRYYADKIKTVNRKVIEDAVNHLRKLDIEFAVMVFHYREDILIADGEVEADWREPFIRSVLDSLEVPLIWTRDLVYEDHQKSDRGYRDYILAGDGHPTSHYNRLVCEEIKKRLAESPLDSLWQADTTNKALYSTRILQNEKIIRADSAWLEQIAQKAIPDGVPMDVAIRGDAAWTLKNELIKELALETKQKEEKATKKSE